MAAVAMAGRRLIDSARGIAVYKCHSAAHARVFHCAADANISALVDCVRLGRSHSHKAAATAAAAAAASSRARRTCESPIPTRRDATRRDGVADRRVDGRASVERRAEPGPAGAT